MNERLRGLLDQANRVFFCGGDSRPILEKLDQAVNESFCLLSRQRTMGIVQSLNEMTELYLSPCEARESRTRKFLNSKSDILETLAKGVVHSTLTERG